MLFSSLIFLYAFLPCTLLTYFLTAKEGKNPGAAPGQPAILCLGASPDI